MDAAGNIFVFIVVGGLVIFSVSSLLSKFSKPATIKQKYPTEIEWEKKALENNPEKFDAWLRSRQNQADKDQEEKHNAISLAIGIPLALIIGAIILAWIYSA